MIMPLPHTITVFRSALGKMRDASVRICAATLFIVFGFFFIIYGFTPDAYDGFSDQNFYAIIFGGMFGWWGLQTLWDILRGKSPEK